MNGYELPEKVQELLKPLNSLDLIQTEINLNLWDVLYKKESSSDILRCYALETIGGSFPGFGLASCLYARFPI
ncbi:hypothetical protein TNCV_3397251 [Trichonephila clavipes]|nr:hypothetical protein TNCV_3397251 [Trichonephila clavipes]